jgi:hypothetical protein
MKGSDNPFPSILVEESTEPTAPAPGFQRLYIDSTTHLLKATNSSGTDRTIEGLTNPMTTAGDLLIGGASGTPARLAAGSTSGHVLTSNGAGVAPSYQAAAGGVTQAYVGYNTVGGSTELITQRRMYLKKITLATACLLTNIEAYVDLSSAAQVRQLAAAVFTDNAGTPELMIAANMPPTTSLIFSVAAASSARWFGLAMGKWLTAGDYWLGVGMMSADSGNVRLYYDGSGSDKYYTESGSWISDAGRVTVNTSANKYSIRGNTIR